ncbi:peptide MFS transporter [Amorphus orientalis]|uniref:POT family proton-dependent oligopeptide transporter n=1 Tax=Amorphus orientalis TaxID=649198 RepID=A0AAE3VNJ1_9HYPH|nr:peptide MFS transporter [Amorphus orientalis]MDQ0315245.1 POT family proton-dependent oligopeptide transporter [Amorphus orientalis]
MFRDQPKALYVLAMTELWERFGYYTLTTVFTLYLVDVLKLQDAQAYLLFGAFTSFAFLTPVLGGAIADRVLGHGRAIILGATMMSAGYLILSLSSTATMYIALGVLVVGNGLFKPNVSALLGHFFGDNDPRRASAFTLFYMGINLGSLGATLIAGILATEFGYWVAFAAAGCGKALALLTYTFGRRFLDEHDAPRDEHNTSLTAHGLVVIALAAMVLISVYLIAHPVAAGYFLAIVQTLVVAGYLVLVFRERANVRNRLLSHLVLVAFSVAFWAVYQQDVTSVMVFTQRDLDLNIFGWQSPPEEFSSLNPFFILALSPLLAFLWPAIERRGINFDDVMKFAFGLAFLGAGYWILTLGIFETPEGAKTMAYWVVLFFLFLSIGELMLSPVGLALTTELAPRHLAGFAMGIWLMATSGANYIAGLLGGLASVPDGTAPARQVEVYSHAFFVYGAICLAAAAGLLMLVPLIRRAMRAG